MKRPSSCLIAASLLAIASPVAAQQTQRPARSPMQTVRAPSMADSAWTRAGYETALQSASGNNLPAQSLERIDLANRVSTLIELGRCTDARNEAREAGDRQMAIRARQLCRADRSPAS